MKPKVLILYNDIKNYRVEAWNCVSEHFDLTVAYPFKDESTTPCNFKKIHYNLIKAGPFFVLPSSIWKMLSDFDVVIFLDDFHYLSYCMLPFVKSKLKFISWGIGFGVSYEHPYNVNRKHTIEDWIYKQLLNKCDACIFYMEKSKEFWNKKERFLSKVFVAPNTTRVKKISLEKKLKKDFLFIGTLYKGKGVDKLIQSFEKLKNTVPNINHLHIVGKGDQQEYLEQLVAQCGLTENVTFHGAIYDEEMLSKLFTTSILCISPTQAGLTVPKSLGYGTPFVCRKDAITGGEMYHAVNGETGVFYDHDEDLFDIMKDALDNPVKYQQMGQKGYDYYYSSATPNHMAQGIIDAINYVMRE